MSNAVFPTLPGLEWAVVKTPAWNTKIQKAVSGKELRAAFFSYALYRFKMSFSVLRASSAYAELQTLMGFVNGRKGSFDNFLYTDPTDNTVTGQSIGIGNGSNRFFQLVRAYGGNAEPVMNINGTPTIKINGVTQTPTTHYTIDGYGYVTFVTAPANGAAVTWDGAYYYRCRFAADENDFENFMYQLWSTKRIEMIGSLGDKI